jgi:tetratricopeptide (TPR) repeat protein
VAQYNFALGYYLTAAKDYQRLLRAYPHSALRAEAYYWLASSKLAIGAADSAAFYFSRVIDEHAGSSMISWAKMGLVDAYYIQQDFPRARSHCQRFMETYSQSHLVPMALFRLAEIYDALGEREKAIETMGRLVRSHPDTYQGKQAQRQLTEWDWTGGEEQQQGPMGGNYTVQVGAFSKRANALNLQGQLRSWGYPVELVKRAGQHRTLYLVWTGHYETREEALQAAKELEKERGLPFQILKR